MNMESVAAAKPVSARHEVQATGKRLQCTSVSPTALRAPVEGWKASMTQAEVIILYLIRARILCPSGT